MIEAETDVLIFGGGVAGLWLLAALRARGYSALLVESDQLGAGQTLAAQGIIHGGLKYAVDGRMTAAARRIREMPAAWRAALQGVGPVDLRDARVLSEDYYLWLPPGLGGGLRSLIASQAWRARARRLTKADWPEFFRSGGADGNLIVVDEFVLDVGSVVRQLADRHRDCIRKIAWPDGIALDGIDRGAPVEIAGAVRLAAKHHVFTAGAGIEDVVNRLGLNSIEAQRRPLHQLMIKGMAAPLYAHCVATGAAPRLTITSHRAAGGEIVWYLGGQLAEDGVDLAEPALIDRGRAELARFLPWVDLAGARFAGYRVDRAAPRQAGRRRPDAPAVHAAGQVLFAWPTKLAFAPRLAELVVDSLARSGVRPGAHEPAAWADLPIPEIGKPPWETATWR